MRLFYLIFCIAFLYFPFSTKAQLQAYTEKNIDNNCQTIYLVNPTDSIYYVAGLKQGDLENCQTFTARHKKDNPEVIRISISLNEENYLLLLPKDTIAYKILMNQEMIMKHKELFLFLRPSPQVISINEDKKRLRKIEKLEGRNMTVVVKER
ncbi:MAG: hypothetical protein JSS64_11210 [Bacteroidetes bacterium]|nr:hypothetical protein [Bacteroidota bacterium]